jgi:GGDEF domain-containing protein
LHLDIDDNNHSPSEAMRSTGQLLKNLLRWADMIGHDQQGNFMMILPETTGEAASILAEKISQQIQEIPGIRHSHVGITEWRKGDSTSSLMKRVGSALVDACETDSQATLSA